MIRNKLNGKLYIGQTFDLEDRWKGHLKKSSNCRYLKHAFKKYGVDNFELKVVIICFDEDMNRYEIDYIRKYHTLVPNGYNLREGGNNGKHHEETKNKIRDALCGKPHPKGIQQKHSEETKDKISKALKGRKQNENSLKAIREKANEQMKIVIQEDLTGTIVNKFKSGLEAAKYFDVSKAAVSMVCNGKRHTLKGFKLRYDTNEIESIY